MREGEEEEEQQKEESEEKEEKEEEINTWRKERHTVRKSIARAPSFSVICNADTADSPRAGIVVSKLVKRVVSCLVRLS